MIPKFINIIMSGALLAFLSSSVLAEPEHVLQNLRAASEIKSILSELPFPETEPKVAPMTATGQEKLTELRDDLISKVNVISRLVAQDLSSDTNQFTPPKKFTVEVDTSEGTVYIEMEDILVIGDGNGCALDPPGISCECPCPE